jgi:hypothetical protein
MRETGNSLTLMLRYEGSLNRSYEKPLKQLVQLQSNRSPRGPLDSFRIFEPAAATRVDNPIAGPNLLPGVQPQIANPIVAAPLRS